MALEIIRFGLVGGLATLTHMATAVTLALIFPGYPFAVNLCGFVVAFVVSYVGHSRFTFRSKGNAPRFLVAALAGLAANNGVLAVLLAVGMLPAVSIALATLAAPIIVYIISKFWVFAANA